MSIKRHTVLKVGILLEFLFLFSFFGHAQLKKPNCKKVKTGTFYFYPAESKRQYVIVRDSSVQKEIDLKTNETTFFQVNWQNDCTFSTSFIKTTRILSERENFLLHFHNITIKILATNQDFYICKLAIDSLGSDPVIDTLWFKSKIKN